MAFKDQFAVQGIIGPYSDRFGKAGRGLAEGESDFDFDRGAGSDFLAGWDHWPRPLAAVVRSKDHERCLTDVLDFEFVAARLADGDRSQVERIRINLEPGKRGLVGDLWRLILESLDFRLPLLLPLSLFEIVRENLERFLSRSPGPLLVSPGLIDVVCRPVERAGGPNQTGKHQTSEENADCASKSFHNRVFANGSSDAGCQSHYELRWGGV